jgi:hypothetical protein
MATAAKAAFAIALWFAGTAHAHPLVDEGRRLYEEAEFDRAMDSLARAEQATDLSRPDLIELFRLRVLLRVAMEQPDAMEADVERLLSLDPTFDFGDSAPPEVNASVTGIRRRIAEAVGIEARVEPTATGLEVHARATNDAAGLVREIRVRARSGEGAWIGPLPPPLELAMEPDQSLSYRAELIGPGGAILAQAGTEAEPLVWSPGGGGGGDDSDLWIGVGVGIGVAVLAAAVILTTVLVLDAQGPGEQTRPTLPVVARF